MGKLDVTAHGARPPIVTDSARDADTSQAGNSNTAAAEPQLGRLVKRALGWSFLGTAAVRLSSLLSGVLLARLLSPSDFGVYAVGAVALLVTASLNDLGIEATLVRWTGDLKKVAPTATTVVMGSSLALFATFWVGAPWFAELFHSPNAINIVRILSVALIISGAGRVSAGLITRTFDQRSRTAADLAGMVVSIGLSVILALSGFGPYSLAWSHLAGILTTVVIIIIAAPQRVRPGFDRSTGRLLMRSGLPIAGAGLLTVTIQNVDYLVVGSVLGAHALGLYLLAWNISSFPVNLLATAISHVSVAGFAKLQNDIAQLEDTFGRSLGAALGLALPIAALLGGLSLPAIRFVYGVQWSDAAAPLVFLASMGALRVGAQLVTDVLIAVGRGRTVIILQAGWLVALAPALFLGAKLGGIRGVGLAQLGIAMLMIPLYLFALRRMGFLIRRLARWVIRPAFGALCVAAWCVVVQQVGMPTFATVAVAGSTGLVLYLLVIRRMMAPLRLALRPSYRQ